MLGEGARLMNLMVTGGGIGTLMLPMNFLSK